MSSFDPSKQPGVKIAQIFLERVTFGHRDDYLTTTATPTSDSIVGTLNVEVQTGLSEDGKNGLLRLRVKTVPENKPFYEFDIAMVALLTVDGADPNMPLAQYVHTVGAALLYPFMRQVVADLTLRGRFGPVWLSPINLTAPSIAAPTEPLPKLRRRPKKAGAKAL